MITVVLIDDHAVVRSGFAQLLNLEADIDVIAQFGDAAQALPWLLRSTPDVAVMDIAMPERDGLSLLRQVRARRPHFRAIILSIYDTPAFVQNAIEAGACGYLTKRCGPEELVQAVRSVGAGGHYLCAEALSAMRTAGQPVGALKALTPREREIFTLLVRGESVRRIADALTLSHKTVHAHRASILSKLQCATTIELVHFALENNLLAHC
ncbi:MULTISPECIES: response regulator transcription factor [Tenebrionibacter/Tenebrionicola group]|jgi:DNA-binding NarL/FixJ family response regulator|uniref:Response regulator transcription factor n=2 Tax=Tenebrionibacter/Tenebrionicola group TaxID=2969848 RepID=A0A8K0XY16_9ENTR|nr:MULTISPECIES: response regulator transcription factor [Tenebrionibacter/Tenebrionicola group]MBK4716926.1 response regulator transcription factor [Tenebrionibacter intestinalis]MBV4411394.1 response regulator transcription factor [Tenebrionicola larvae]MBV5095836.1 response regulator transcription factor [Tenebrionicola larvae]